MPATRAAWLFAAKQHVHRCSGRHMQEKDGTAPRQSTVQGMGQLASTSEVVLEPTFRKLAPTYAGHARPRASG